MTAAIIDGKRIAADLRAKVRTAVGALVREHGVTPGLAVVLVGDDPASQIYVRNKGRASEAAGMRSIEHRLPATTPERENTTRTDGFAFAGECEVPLFRTPFSPTKV